MAKVIIAIDESEHSERALQWYINGVHRPGNKILLVHCLEMPLLPHDVHGDYLKQVLDAAREEGGVTENKYIKRLKDENLDGSFVLVADFHKHIGKFICETAEKENALMVILGTRGKGLIRRTILGSVSDYCVHHAACPVVVCRK